MQTKIAELIDELVADSKEAGRYLDREHDHGLFLKWQAEVVKKAAALKEAISNEHNR